MYLDQCGNVMRDVIKLFEETLHDEQQFDVRECATKENYSGTTRETHPTGLGSIGSTRENHDGRGKE